MTSKVGSDLVYEYWQVMNFKFLEQKTEKHEIQMLICGGRLKADENWMNAETS